WGGHRACALWAVVFFRAFAAIGAGGRIELFPGSGAAVHIAERLVDLPGAATGSRDRSGLAFDSACSRRDADFSRAPLPCPPRLVAPAASVPESRCELNDHGRGGHIAFTGDAESGRNVFAGSGGSYRKLMVERD